MKKKGISILLVVAIVTALLVTSLALVACSGAGNKSAGLRRASDVFALAGVSTGAILSDMSGVSNNQVAMAQEENAVSDEVVDELNKYMALVDSLVAGAPTGNKTEASDRPEYQKMQVMSVPGIDGNYTEYILYYNEDAASVATADDEEEEESKDEDEYEAHITGIMVIGTETFDIKGDIEREADEQEIEFTAYLNDVDYIVFSQEVESNESEFEYEIYKNGKFESSFSIEIETEDYKNEFELETEDKNGAKIEYQIKRNTKDNEIEVEYTCDGVKGTFEVVATEDEAGNPIYKYILKDREIDKDRD